MAFWQLPVVSTALLVLGLLAVAEAITRVVPGLRGLGVPAAIIAGMLGLVFGPDLVGWLPFHRETLEVGVYHGLAIVFIALALQEPHGETTGPDARSMGFAVPTMAAIQTGIGLAFVLGAGLIGAALHPGLGLLLVLGFEQGPGQALSLGSAWEASGLVDGGQLGLIIAAVGFGWSILIGIPLVAWGRARGLTSDAAVGPAAQVVPPPPVAPGGLGVLSRQVAVIGVVYAATWGVCAGLAWIFRGMPGIAALAWGFHFIFGAIVAIAFRAVLRRVPGDPVLHDGTLGEVAGITVDLVTCGALAAIEVAVLRANFLPIVVLTTLGGALTLLAIVWLAGRAFRTAPFEHCVLWFGMATGTLPMGLALLRGLDPELRSPAPISAVLGSAIAVPLVAPLLMGIHPLPITGWPDTWPGSGWTALGLTVVYGLVMLAGWWRFGGLRLVGGGLWRTPD